MTARGRVSKRSQAVSQQEVAKARAEATALSSAQPRQKARSAKSRPSSGVPAEIAPACIIAAVESLCTDELKPVGRILRKRIGELWPNLQDVGAEQLRTLCCAHPSLVVEPEEGGDFSALLVGCKQAFVDIYSTHDDYSLAMWSELQAYCESSRGQAMSLPGGRYACAQALVAFELPCLSGYSLGRICHIVQLAITQKKILGYMNGTVVAYSKSQSKVKEQLASEGNALSATRQGALPVAGLNEAREYMRQILRDASGKVPLSTVKNLFRSKCELELSETCLGHAKLSELLQSDDFKSICRVELHEQGYVVIESTPEQPEMLHEDPAQSSAVKEQPYQVLLCSGKTHVPKDVHGIHSLGEHVSFGCSPFKDSTHAFTDGVPLVQRTFIQYNVPRTPIAGSRRRSCSVPKEIEFGQSLCEIVECMEKFGGRASRQSTAASSGHAGYDTPPSNLSDTDQHDSGLISAEEQDAPSGEVMMHSVSSWADEPLQFEDAGDISDSSWVDEPLQLEDEDGVSDNASFQNISTNATRWHPLTPGMLAKEGCRVQNTFFHISPSLPTPVRMGAARRSKSVPREVGSTTVDLRPTDHGALATHTSSISQSTPLVTPAMFWPSTPAEIDTLDSSFSWTSTQLVAPQPSLLAPVLHVQQCPPLCATHHNVLFISQHL